MKNIVPNENCLSEAQLLHYLRDECSTAEEKAIDRHLTICPMCSDALEGTMLLNSARLERSLAHVEAKIDTRFSDKKHDERKAIILDEEEQPTMTVVKSPRKWGWLWAAASLTVIAAASLWIFTKPMDYNVASTVADTTTLPDSNAPQVTMAVPTADSTVETTQNTTKTGTGLGTTPSSTNRDVAVATEKTGEQGFPTPPAATPTTHTQANSAPATASKPNYTEGAPLAANADETKDADVAVADTYNKERKKEQSATNVQAESSINNYPGAAQNNVGKASPSREVKTKQTANTAVMEYQIGMQFYQKGAFNEAIGSLNRALAKQNNENVYQDALWYLANSYLKLSKKQDAQILLKRIVAEKGKYAQQAAALLK